MTSSTDREGWVLVPREPTEEMLAEADSAIPRFELEGDGSRLMGRDGALDVWNIMVEAAPPRQWTDEEVERTAAIHFEAHGYGRREDTGGSTVWVETKWPSLSQEQRDREITCMRAALSALEGGGE